MIGGPHTIDERTYRHDSGLNYSLLKNIQDSPSKAKWRQMNPKEPTAAMKLGTMMHYAVLEPDKFLDLYTVAPTVNKRTKAGRDELAEIESSGKTPLAKDVYDDAITLAHRVNSGHIGRYIKNAEFETSWFADHDFGVRVKGRLDAWLPEKNIIVDLKTCQSASPWEFGKQVRERRYDAQAAFYCDLVAKITGQQVSGYLWLAVETTEDKDVAAYLCDEALLQKGRRDYERWMRTWIACDQTGCWPGYPDELNILSAPDWFLNKLD